MGNPCTACGAYCAFYRVGFYWTEAEPFLGGTVPPSMTRKCGPHRVVMAGTDRSAPRCVALAGTVGSDVACTIYADRPSPCRDLAPSWVDGTPSPQCDRARLAHGLKPLTSNDWIGPIEPGYPPTPSRRAG